MKMKFILALAISAWLGAAMGALVDTEVPEFWFVWTAAGIGLAVITTIYLMSLRRTT